LPGFLGNAGINLKFLPETIKDVKKHGITKLVVNRFRISILKINNLES